jgi:hypothetical protein
LCLPGVGNLPPVATYGVAMAWDNLLSIVDSAIVAQTGILQWGTSVTYKSSDGTVSSLSATKNTTDVEYEDQGVWVRSKEVMWLVRVGDLQTDGTELTPKRNDILTDGTDTFDYVSHSLDGDGTMYQITMQKADL